MTTLQLANYNIPLPLQTLVDAGFVVTDKVDKINHYYRFYLLHESVFEMSSEQAHDQPCIEIGIPDETLAGSDSFPVYIEGRYGAMCYPIKMINQLHLFMRNFGYTYPETN